MQSRSMIKLWELATEVYGESVGEWFETPNIDMKEQTPAELVQRSSEGYDFVERFLRLRLRAKQLPVRH